MKKCTLTQNSAVDTLPLQDEAPKEEISLLNKLKAYLKSYTGKWCGVSGMKNSQVRPPLPDMIQTFVGTVVGLGIISALHYYGIGMAPVKNEGMALLIGSFGASCVLIFSEYRSPLAQPRNFFLGHLISAFIGVVVKILIVISKQEKYLVPFGAAFAVSLSIVAMHITRTSHPPGGASALNAVIASNIYPWYGFQFILMPVMSGCLVLFLVAIVINNLQNKNSYPLYWW